MRSKIKKAAEKLVEDLSQPCLVEIGIYEEPEKLAGLLTANGLRAKVVRNVLLADSRDESEVKKYIKSNDIKEKYQLEKVWQVNQ